MTKGARKAMNEQNTVGAILVVEDEWMVASEIESLILSAGYQVAGPAADLERALELASKEPIAAALLDIELSGGDQVYPVAEALMARDIPFAFISSRPRDEIDPAYRYLPHIGKPFDAQALLSTLSDLIRDRY
jgi:DNA-binding response OmpR family regulator